MNRKNASKVRPRTIAFIKSKLGENFTFLFEGDEEAVKLFISAMRTDLSRLRAKARERGKVPRHFKMLTISVLRCVDNEGNLIVDEYGEAIKWQVTLRKSENSLNVSNDIDEIMDDIAGGDVIDG